MKPARDLIVLVRRREEFRGVRLRFSVGDNVVGENGEASEPQIG